MGLVKRQPRPRFGVSSQRYGDLGGLEKGNYSPYTKTSAVPPSFCNRKAATWHWLAPISGCSIPQPSQHDFAGRTPLNSRVAPACAGLAALQHAVQEAPPAALRPRRALLAEVALQAVGGADDALWPAAAPAACAVTAAVEGAPPNPIISALQKHPCSAETCTRASSCRDSPPFRLERPYTGREAACRLFPGADVWSPAYDAFARAMLSEAELHQHKASHSLVWLRAMTPLLQVRAASPPPQPTPPPPPRPRGAAGGPFH